MPSICCCFARGEETSLLVSIQYLKLATSLPWQFYARCRVRDQQAISSPVRTMDLQHCYSEAVQAAGVILRLSKQAQNTHKQATENTKEQRTPTGGIPLLSL